MQLTINWKYDHSYLKTYSVGRLCFNALQKEVEGSLLSENAHGVSRYIPISKDLYSLTCRAIVDFDLKAAQLFLDYYPSLYLVEGAHWRENVLLFLLSKDKDPNTSPVFYIAFIA